MSKTNSKTEIAKSLRAAVAASLAAGKPGLTMTARGRSVVGTWIELDGVLTGSRLMATEENKVATQAFPSRSARLVGAYTVDFPVGSHLDFVARKLAEQLKAAA